MSQNRARPSRIPCPMIVYRTGDLFDSTADALAHGCNTEGRMGAGIAREFRRRWPSMYDDYARRCRQGAFPLGSGYLYANSPGPHVVNLATQTLGGATLPSVDAAFGWLASAWRDLRVRRVAMPRIGAGLGRLDWAEVRKLLEKHFAGLELEVEVWTLPEAGG